MASAETRGGQNFIFGDVQKKILKSLQEAEKDNDFIYHAKIPDLTYLTPIAKAAVAKSIPLSSPISPQFKGHLYKSFKRFAVSLQYFEM
jgi:programmed cell death 6-interacting protein